MMRGAELPAEGNSGALPPPESRGDDVLDAVDEPGDRSLVAPAEPLVSAWAIGIAAIADPTPNATASAPTRPT